jgi:hypothetical protein
MSKRRRRGWPRSYSRWRSESSSRTGYRVSSERRLRRGRQ